MRKLKSVADLVNELKNDFDKLASNNPDLADEYIMENYEYLESLEILKEFDAKTEYYRNEYHHDDYLREQEEAYDERMSFYANISNI